MPSGIFVWLGLADSSLYLRSRSCFWLPTRYSLLLAVGAPVGRDSRLGLATQDSGLDKTLGVITSPAGARSRRIRVTCLQHPDFRMAQRCPSSHGEVAGVASFLGLRVAPPELCSFHIRHMEIFSNVHPSQLQNKPVENFRAALRHWAQGFNGGQSLLDTSKMTGSNLEVLG